MKNRAYSIKRTHNILRYLSFRKNNTEQQPNMMIDVSAIDFAKRDMHLFSCQFMINGPKAGFDSNLPYIFSEDRAKQAAARRTKGVVGINGRKIPINASPMNKKPNVLYTSNDSEWQDLLIGINDYDYEHGLSRKATAHFAGRGDDQDLFIPA
jgi:hypothetical protein